MLRTLGRKREKLTSRDLVIWPERQKMELAPDFFETFVALGKHFFLAHFIFIHYFSCAGTRKIVFIIRSYPSSRKFHLHL